MASLFGWRLKHVSFQVCVPTANPNDQKTFHSCGEPNIFRAAYGLQSTCSDPRTCPRWCLAALKKVMLEGSGEMFLGKSPFCMKTDTSCPFKSKEQHERQKDYERVAISMEMNRIISCGVTLRRCEGQTAVAIRVNRGLSAKVRILGTLGDFCEECSLVRNLRREKRNAAPKDNENE